jgi:hypothetical protein
MRERRAEDRSLQGGRRGKMTWSRNVAHLGVSRADESDVGASRKDARASRCRGLDVQTQRAMKLKLWARVLLALCVAAAVAWPAEAAKPNIIFILADDLGSGDVGVYGGTLVPLTLIKRN